MSIEATAIHECAHAVGLMVHGHTPIELSIDGSGGHVQFPDGVDEEEAAVIGLMGGCAVMQILGTDADCDASASDCQFLASLYAHGNRNSIDRIIRGRADWLVSQHATAIVDMANEVLRRPSTSRLTHSVHLSKDDIGEIVRSTTSLQQFARLFPYSPPRQKATRASTTKHDRYKSTSADRTMIDKLIAQAMAGKPTLIGVPKSFFGLS